MVVVALIWGVAAFVGLSIGLIPCLGALNWLNVPFSVCGGVFSIVAMAKQSRAGEPNGGAIAGLALCTVAAALGLVRLILGGGVV